MLFVSSYECPVVIYHLMTATCLLKVSNVCDVCYCGTFDPSRNTFYTGGADGKLVVWKFNVVDKDAESGTTSSTSSHQSSAATTSEQLCENMSVSLWCERVMDHPPEVYCLAYFTHPHTADEVHLVSGGSDGDIRVWHLETGHLLRVLTGHVGIVRKLVIQRGRQLISTGDQRRIIIWNLSVAKTMQSVIATNSSESTDRKQLLFRSDPQRVLQPLITDAGIDSEKEAIVLHRNPISIDSLFVDDFSVFIGSPDYPGSVGAILFW